ncbi:hypothetical protein BDZ89DRAFT_1046316 [Hymenopellis radicata]|nr:hypothetical protein BDZ89DRAFT_1046316 [Hymenopellis radicata]
MAVATHARLSSDSDGNSVPHTNGLNGDADTDPVARLHRELQQTREEKDTLAAQYRNLLQKLTHMKTTLGNKLKQDAEELDRREQLIQQLTAQNDDLAQTVETLKDEFIASNEETARVSNQLDTLRNRAFQENAQESLMRERELRETQLELERCRIERDDWERVAMQEKTMSDESRSLVDTLKRDIELEREVREREAAELEVEREKSENLQSVLQDFQAAKDHELRQAVKDRDSQLHRLEQDVAEFKHRALTAEVAIFCPARYETHDIHQLALEESQTNTTRTQDLEKAVKEKDLLIGKLRHEAVIINEHLMEALRRLRRSSSDTNVDRRLVTNVLLSFLQTPRADPKRFEMLQLLSTILSWTDPEREKAGLQRTSNSSMVSSSSSFWGRPSLSSNSPAKGNGELQKTDETESFSRLWVEFLLTEAASGEGAPPPPRNNSLPGTPTRSTFSPPSPSATMRRLSSTATASSPNLSLVASPSPKGKGRADPLPEDALS